MDTITKSKIKLFIFKYLFFNGQFGLNAASNLGRFISNYTKDEAAYNT